MITRPQKKLLPYLRSEDLKILDDKFESVFLSEIIACNWAMTEKFIHSLEIYFKGTRQRAKLRPAQGL